uniref:Beta-hexosaminidase A n=1 Tax=Acrobeloides nanus TaxID=290746 RepID=A0A914EA23_9BILA
MIDSSRHFLSVSILKRNLDLMAQNKMNVFHWHLTDSEAFPYESKRFPDLSAKGAYTTKHVYTQSQIQDIIAYARLRGIRVVPEFDTPGHTGAWGAGMPGLLSLCYDQNYQNTILGNIIDPTKDANWDFLTQFFDEALNLFPDNYMHFGGDEVASYMLECWYRNSDVLNWMQQHGMGKDTTQLLNYYFQKLVQLVKTSRSNTSMIFWQEVLDSGVAPPSSIAHVWKGDTYDDVMSEMYQVTAAGHYAILSSCWYLNYIKYGADWGYVDNSEMRQRGMYYQCDPTAFGGSQAQIDLVLGGEAALWGEFVDGTNLIPRLWPRASAVAERLWSDPAQTQSADAAWPRLHEHKCRMMARGYPVEPPNDPDYCPDYWDPSYPDLS